MANDKILIRLANDADFDAIFLIWLDGIENSFDKNTFDEAVLKEKFNLNFNNREGIFNFWVAILGNEIIGWQSLIKTSYNPFRENTYAESSTYIKRNCRFKGLGQLLIAYVMKEAENSQLEYVIGFISVSNLAARKITKETGWVEVGEVPPSLKGSNNYPKILLMKPV